MAQRRPHSRLDGLTRPRRGRLAGPQPPIAPVRLPFPAALSVAAEGHFLPAHLEARAAPLVLLARPARATVIPPRLRSDAGRRGTGNGDGFARENPVLLFHVATHA